MVLARSPNTRLFDEPFQVGQVGRVDLFHAGQQVGQLSRFLCLAVDLVHGAVLGYDSQKIVDDLHVGIQKQIIDLFQLTAGDRQPVAEFAFHRFLLLYTPFWGHVALYHISR
jgi:hypothetical protein